jgi:hypothetical protein
MLRRVLVLTFALSFTLAASVGMVGQVQAQGAGAAKIDYTKSAPLDLVKNTPKGKLVNPYKDTQAAIVAAGSQLFHGGGGGGGICPPLTNGVWIYGGSDDTLFRLVTLGSDELQKAGYSRQAVENVVAPMPPFGGAIKSADDLWKILTFVRSKYDGDPGYKYGDPAAKP